jgi:hypothetical protein
MEAFLMVAISNELVGSEPSAELVGGERHAVASSREDFVMQVLLDGRYIHRFTTETREVARRLGVELDDTIENEIRDKDGYRLLSDTCDSMTNELTCRVIGTGITPGTPVLGVGTAIGIIGLAIAAISVVTAAGVMFADPEDEIIDTSPMAASKL